jgi:hypothetical protein
MKLAEHVEEIRQLIDKAFRNRLGRMGITASMLQPIDAIPDEYRLERERIQSIWEVLIAETGTKADAYEKLIEEFTFTLFNRLAALKVMEAHALNPEIITRRSQHGDRSFAHLLWLEQNPDRRSDEQEGLLRFMEDQLNELADNIPLYSLQHPYHLLPTAIELNSIINAFNLVETDAQVETDIWKSDDVLGWLYESYNNYKKTSHKESGDKTEYNKVSIQSQVYTPRWVVKFLVDNSLGKLYLEMFPDSAIKEKYKIIYAPKAQIREKKPLTEIRLIDPAVGSGNFLLYAFDLFYDLYHDQKDNYGARYEESNIPELIIRNNLHGVDLDDRAVQLAQLGLYIKAKRQERSTKIEHFNIVSSDFFLPNYLEVKHLFENGERLSSELEKIVTDLWVDLQKAYKFGSLIKLEEKFNLQLHSLEDKEIKELNLFTEQNLANYEQFRENFFTNLQKVVAHNTERQGLTFLNTKTHDAITFLQLFTQKYDVAVANPPYTDSADFGPELKKFINNNYKKPDKFNSNLYATFIQRCYELTNKAGYIALIHMNTFMFIKSFEDVRKWIIEHTHIDILVDYGLDRVNLFGPGILLDATWYVLSKKKKNEEGVYLNIISNQQEKNKKGSFELAFDDVLNKCKNERIYTIDQSKFKIIEGWPFIYWISDGFREKFRGNATKDFLDNCQGMATTNNNRFVRFWWEVEKNSISLNYLLDNKKWVPYIKGGPFNKWYGNLWCVVNYYNNGEELIELVKNKYPKISDPEFVIKNRKFYFQEGINYSASGQKGTSFRYHSQNHIFDVGGASIFPTTNYKNIPYIIALFNSKLCAYIINCLNPTVNTQSGDIERVPFIIPKKEFEGTISTLSSKNIEIKKYLCSYRIVETNFNKNPLSTFTDSSLRDRMLSFLNFENELLTMVLLNEAIIDQLIFEVYTLSPEDRNQVEAKIGKPVGELPVLLEAREAYLLTMEVNETTKEFIQNLSVITFEEKQLRVIKDEFISLYQNNNDLEEFCIRHSLNPINIWYWFRESKVLPQSRAVDITLEFLADACRTILIEDEDGIIPLVGLPSEPRLLDRLEQYCLKQGFTSAQFMQLDGLLGRPINEYMEHYFFKDFSDHLNLFMFLPKTPFIWHLSSGEQHGFEVYIIIYKWNRDSLFKLKSTYLSKRVENLQFRQIQLSDSNTAQAQNEKETIRLQLQEIAEFTRKIDGLIAEGYDPKLDDGVGKNIAPLQKKGMLRCEVLNDKQLDKYLKADW